MVGISSHFIEIVVLSRHPQAFLCIGKSAVPGDACSQEIVFELFHTGVGEHERRISLGDDWRRFDDFMIFRPEELQKVISDLDM